MVRCLPAIQETQVLSLGWEDSPEKEMATHSSLLAWRIPWTEETGRLHCSENKGSLIIFSPVKEIQGIGENCWGKSCLLLLFQENLNNAALNISSGVKPHAYVLLPPRV